MEKNGDTTGTGAGGEVEQVPGKGFEERDKGCVQRTFR